MPSVGRLRLRDERLVVEGMAGEILAEIEPDSHMVIDNPIRHASFLARALGLPDDALEVTLTVRWTQVVGMGPSYIDAEVVDDAPARPELEGPK